MNASETTDRAADAIESGVTSEDVRLEELRRNTLEACHAHLDGRTTEQLAGYLKSFAAQDQAADATDDDHDVDEEAAEVAAESNVNDDEAREATAKPYDVRQNAYDAVKAHIDRADIMQLICYQASFAKADRDLEQTHKDEVTDGRRMRLGQIMDHLERIRDDDDLDVVARVTQCMCDE